jgi:SatD family (SatD)
MKQKNKDYIILMGDIIQSNLHNQSLLMLDFQEVVHTINVKYQDKILSPLTITLGDEFQGVVADTKTVINIIIDIEELILIAHKSLKIRYICHEGIIETPINSAIAYGMLGAGLTNARKQLEAMKKGRMRFLFSLKNNNINTIFNNAFIIYAAIINHWKIDDLPIVALFLKGLNYDEVAKSLNKNRSLIWKREKNLRLTEYFAIKKILKNS